MNERIQQNMRKLDELAKRAVKVQPTPSGSTTCNDGLIKAIRTKEDADRFMDELDAIGNASK